MARIDDWLWSCTQPRRLCAAATCVLGAALLLVGCGGGAGGAPEATLVAGEQVAADAGQGGNEDSCSLTALQSSLEEMGPLEGNVSIDSVSLNTGGSFTPPGATAPITEVPDFCRVTAVARPTADSHINFEIWLPIADWNDKYLSIGEGGLQGAIGYAPLADGLRRGYATASTDAGHSAADPWWMVAHPEKAIDGGYRAKHLQAVAAKAVIAAYYGDAPSYSYHAGCSGGGRQGLMELQRYPDDYDGYIVGAPANNWTGQTTNWIMKALAVVGDPAGAIPASKLPAIQAAALAQCDTLDGLQDGIISDPRQCNFNPDVLACPAGKEDNTACLTTPQLSALKQIYRGPVDSAGRLLFPGDEPGADVGSEGAGASAPIFQNLFGIPTMGGLVYNRSDWDFRTFDFDVDPKVMEAAIGGIYNANDPDLRVQKAKGIKVIQYHGWADQALSPRESINYYDRVVEQVGGVAETQDFFRLFMAPGMAHCAGGPGPNHFGQGGGGSVGPFIPTSTAADDIVKALEKWVEEGVAPDQLIATKYTSDVITEPALIRRPLCPYPKVQKYNGTGDPNVETSFSCGEP